MRRKVIAIDPQGRKIVMAPNKKVKLHGAFIPVVLAELGHPEALVTDLSSVHDFAPTMGTVKKLARMVGCEVSMDTLVYQLAGLLEVQAQKWVRAMPQWLANGHFRATGKSRGRAQVVITVEGKR